MNNKVRGVFKNNPVTLRLYTSCKDLPHLLPNAHRRAQNRLSGGISIPSGRLIFLVTGTYNVNWFLQSGALSAQAIRDQLAKNGGQIERFNHILDFGCGVGRVMRHWSHLSGPKFYGADINPTLIHWCRKQLPFAQFDLIHLGGKLDFEDERFDLVYTLSVFTHLTESEQLYWINEVTRVLKPGGYLIITTHGDFFLPRLSPEERERYLQGELIIRGEVRQGSNLCNAFVPFAYIRDHLAKGLTILDFIPEGAYGNPHQDQYLLQKPIIPE